MASFKLFSMAPLQLPTCSSPESNISNRTAASEGCALNGWHFVAPRVRVICNARSMDHESLQHMNYIKAGLQCRPCMIVDHTSPSHVTFKGGTSIQAHVCDRCLYLQLTLKCLPCRDSTCTVWTLVLRRSLLSLLKTLADQR